ncbi:hypothetical protein [Bacillus sp. REN10]|uniref:hypothetical protein n=1 Tax=Bacillus sp. REN10 TaxID=2782541 RepID=UPI00193B95A0|nr:hypothetical protein [Bacillus sp. REN10]
MLRLPLVRYLLFGCVLLLLLFEGYFTVGTFFIISTSFAVIEKLLDKKDYDKKTGKKAIDYGWVLILALTFLTIYRIGLTSPNPLG